MCGITENSKTTLPGPEQDGRRQNRLSGRARQVGIDPCCKDSQRRRKAPSCSCALVGAAVLQPVISWHNSID